jgi:uncharacterized protein with von Willebrand factor type A (vWA) domain
MRPPDALLAEAAVALGRALREAGVGAAVDEELVLCRALAEIDITRRERVYWAARAAFVRRRDDIDAFDHVFSRFWDGLSLDAAAAAVAEHGETDPRMPAPQHGGESLPQYRADGRSGRVLDDHGSQATSPLEIPTAPSEVRAAGERRGVLAAYSPTEVLTEREALGFGAPELAALRRLAEDLRHSVPERRSRRLVASRRGRLDVRRTVRRSLETEGEAFRPRYLASSRRPRRLLFLCDVSGSMERYSRALLASLQAAVGASAKTEAFVFATRLTRLTRSLSRHDAARALDEARASVVDWSGGTRIGQVLFEFRRGYGRLGLARGAIVVIVSDGWDRGDPDLLAAELAALRLQCRRLVWVNPRPSDLEGQPLAVGMRVSLPYVDDFVPGHDPRAIAGLARLIGGLGRGRPSRRQRVPGVTVLRRRPDTMESR